MNKKKIKILCSVDDGAATDLGLGDLLLQYRIPTVFYIPTNVTDLSHKDIRCLAGRGHCPIVKKTKGLFTVGSHSVNHPHGFGKLSDEVLFKEASESKKELENIIGAPVTRFCYPHGNYSDRAMEIIKKAGYKEARTTEILSIDFPENPFKTVTSVQVSPIRSEYGEIKTWVEWGEELFEKVIKEGGRFEIWLHSRDIEKFHQEEFLNVFLEYMDEQMTAINYKREI